MHVQLIYNKNYSCESSFCDNKHQRWDPILTSVSVLNTYVVHDLNGLDAYILCIVHEQDSVVAMHKRTNYMNATAHVLYST